MRVPHMPTHGDFLIQGHTARYTQKVAVPHELDVGGDEGLCKRQTNNINSTLSLLFNLKSMVSAIAETL